ncbi:hypothetical protein BH10PLA2_BH10PLA2_02210 [soil metagenome]
MTKSAAALWHMSDYMAHWRFLPLRDMRWFEGIETTAQKPSLADLSNSAIKQSYIRYWIQFLIEQQISGWLAEEVDIPMRMQT